MIELNEKINLNMDFKYQFSIFRMETLPQKFKKNKILDGWKKMRRKIFS